MGLQTQIHSCFECLVPINHVVLVQWNTYMWLKFVNDFPWKSRYGAGVVWQLPEEYILQAENCCSTENSQHCSGIFLADELPDGHRFPRDTLLVCARWSVGRDSYVAGRFIGLLDNQ